VILSAFFFCCLLEYFRAKEEGLGAKNDSSEDKIGCLRTVAFFCFFLLSVSHYQEDYAHQEQ
jgi:hypothetical protein